MATEKNFYNYDAMMEVLNPLLDTCYDFAGISREQLPVVFIVWQSDDFSVYYSTIDHNLQVNLAKYTEADLSSEDFRNMFFYEVFAELRSYFQLLYLEEKYGANLIRRVLIQCIALDADSKETNFFEEDAFKAAKLWSEMCLAGEKPGTCQEQMEELEKIITADKILETMKKHFE